MGGTTTRCGLESNGSPDYTAWRYTMGTLAQGCSQIKSKLGKKNCLDHSFLNNRRHSLACYSLVTPSHRHSLLICVCRLWLRYHFFSLPTFLSSHFSPPFIRNPILLHETTPEKRKPTIIPIISYQSHSFPTISIYPYQFLSTSPNSLWNFHPPLNLFDFDVNRIHYYITKSKQNRWFQQFVIKAYHPNPMHIHSVDFLLTSYPATIWTYSNYLLYLSLLTFVFFSPFFFGLTGVDWVFGDT